MAVGAVVFGQFATAALVPGRAQRPVRDRQRTGLAADRGQSRTSASSGPIETARPAHRADGHLQQDRRHPGAGADRHAGAAWHRRPGRAGARWPMRRPRRCCSMNSPPRSTMPYMVMAGAAGGAGGGDPVLAAARNQDRRSQCNAGARARAASASIFQFPHLWLGVLCLFVYVGVEVMAGDAIGTYGQASACRWTRPRCSPRSPWSRCWSATWSGCR